MGGCLQKEEPSTDPLSQIHSLSPTAFNLSPRPSTQSTATTRTTDDHLGIDAEEESADFSYLECCPFCHSQSEPFSEFQLVILGAGYSGKTTLRHHLVQRFGHAFCRADLLMYRDILQQNVLDLFRDLLRAPALSLNDLRAVLPLCIELDDLSIDTLPDTHSAPQHQHRVDGVHGQTLSMKALLNQLGREELKYGRDSGRYLILNSRRILAAEFEPKFEDLLQCHVRSTGLMLEHHVLVRGLPVHESGTTLSGGTVTVDINDDGGGTVSGALSSNAIELDLCRENVVFRVVDVGGHRNERKKWDYVLRQSNDVVVFVVSAASFCQNLFEDFKENAMRESLSVWDHIVAAMARSPSPPPIVLVLNKMDLFRSRWPLFPRFFKEFDAEKEGKDRAAVLRFIKRMFLDIADRHGLRRNVHCVATKLTEPDAVSLQSVDVEETRSVLMAHRIDSLSLHKDIVDEIVSFAVGDCFWSSKWLQNMWRRKMQQNEAATENVDTLPPPLARCDHVNHPHDFQAMRSRSKRRSRSRSAKQSLSRRISSFSNLFHSNPALEDAPS